MSGHEDLLRVTNRPRAQRKSKNNVYIYLFVLLLLLIVVGYMIGKSVYTSIIDLLPPQPDHSITLPADDQNDPETDSPDETVEPGSQIPDATEEPGAPVEPPVDPSEVTDPPASEEPDKPDHPPSDKVDVPPILPPPTAQVMRYLPAAADQDDKSVALTFDDGPDDKFTIQILDILKEYQIKATFFLVGKQIERYPDIVKRIFDEGHDIGNHTWGHKQLSQLKQAQALEEIRSTNELIESITGYPVYLFRAPYGDTSGPVMSWLQEENQHVIGWSVDTLDWNGTPADEIMNILKKQLKSGGIILQHSFGGKNSDLSNTIEALPQMIDYLVREGYRFSTVTEAIYGAKSSERQ